MTNEAEYSRRLETESPRMWDLRGEELATKGWMEDDPIEFVIRYPTSEEQEFYDTAFRLGHPTVVIVELHNARNDDAEPILVPGLVPGGMNDDILRLLGYEIDAGTGAAAYHSPFMGPFDGERQFPPKIGLEIEEQNTELFQSMEGPFFGECRIR